MKPVNTKTVNTLPPLEAECRKKWQQKNLKVFTTEWRKSLKLRQEILPTANNKKSK